MKEYRVIFKHGHFVDTVTNSSLHFVPGAHYQISAEAQNFSEEKDLLQDVTFVSSNKTAERLIGKYGKERIKKLTDAGTTFFFRIGGTKRETGDTSNEYIFTCVVLEDLYMCRKERRKGDEVDDWRLAECKCVLEECKLGGLFLFRKNQGISLNQLYSRVVITYFSEQRSTTCNAFHDFYFYEPSIELTFNGAINGFYRGLRHEREDYVKSIQFTMQKNKG